MARLILVASYQFWLQDTDNAIKLHLEAKTIFTDLALSKYLASIAYRFQGNIQECIDGMSYLIEAAQEQLEPFGLQCHYELGSTYMKLSAWDKAITHFEKFYEENKGEAFRCLCGHELGVAYTMTKNYEKAKTCFRYSIKHLRNDIPWEIYFARKSKEFLSSGIPELMSPWEICYFEARERWKTSKWNECIQILEKGKGLVNTADQRACYNLTMGHCHKKLGLLDKAKEYHTLAAQEKVHHETWVTPHALVDLGDILMQSENTMAEGVKLLNKAKSNFDGYDFRNILLRDIALLLDGGGKKYCLI